MNAEDGNDNDKTIITLTITAISHNNILWEEYLLLYHDNDDGNDDNANNRLSNIFVFCLFFHRKIDSTYYLPLTDATYQNKKKQPQLLYLAL